MIWKTVIEYVDLTTGEIQSVKPTPPIDIIKIEKNVKIKGYGLQQQGIITLTKFYRQPERKQGTIF